MLNCARCFRGGRGFLETKTKFSLYELLNWYRIILFSNVCNLNSKTSLKLKILKVDIHCIIFITIFKTRKKWKTLFSSKISFHRWRKQSTESLITYHSRAGVLAAGSLFWLHNHPHDEAERSSSCEWVNYSCVVSKLRPTLCNPMFCSPPGSSVHGVSQARILEWVAISFSKGSSQSWNQTRTSFISCIAGGFFTTEPPGKPKL